MPTDFDAFFSRVIAETNIPNQLAMAEVLGVHRSAITQAKNRKAVPDKWILSLARRYGLAPDWLETGAGDPRGRTLKHNPASIQALTGPDSGIGAAPPPSGLNFEGTVVLVPKVRARLCAGGGSLEVEAVPVAEYPFPSRWLSGFGNPGKMVFMDVVGDSMEPEIRDGDMVMVDQSLTEHLVNNAVMAVGYEDNIFIKRLARIPGGIALLSDNPEYSPIRVQGDDLESLRVIGKVVWMCRDLH